MDAHLEFEKEMANFLGYEDCISFVSCWSANNGVFSALLDENDAIVSADLNHASIIDGIRLCKAKRFFYKYDDLNDLERALKEAKAVAKNIMIVSDGVFSMDGDIANIHGLGELSEKYEALLMIDDSHATGFIGENGRGSAEYRKAEGKIDILSSTLGKALGGSGGGFICSKREIVEKLRNKARPYLFSNNITPMVARVSLKVLDIIKNSKELIKKSFDNTKYFRQRMVDAGFDVWLGVEGIHPIVPIMLGDAKLADDFSKQMLENGVYVVGLSYPVVPKDKARIRVQISSAHSKEHIDKCVNAFVKVGKMLKVV
jgi:glycine C-acetyltransferase